MLNLKLPGQLIAVYEEKMALDSVNHGCNVIFIGDPVGMVQFQDIFISGAAFIPKVEAMQMLVNGNRNGFVELYNMQLYNDPIVREFLDTIVCALYQGKTIVLYIPEIAFGFAYHEILFQYISNVYGLYVQKDKHLPYYQKFGYITVIDALYNFNQIDEVLYLSFIPDEILEDPEFMKRRLCVMFGLEYNRNNVEYLKNWKQCINNANRPLRPMVSFRDGS